MAKDFNIDATVSALVCYGETNLGLNLLDKIYAYNQLLSLFDLTEPTEFKQSVPDLQTKILDPLVDYAVKKGLCKDDERLLFETKLMGMITPCPSNVESEFDYIAARDSISSATDYLNNLSIKNNYIRMCDINKNIKWTAPGEMGNLVITINLSKPEKDNKQVMLERSLPPTNYPKCPICIENIGFVGSIRQSPRQTLRGIPIVLGDEEWLFQFSPYVYYDNHCIAISYQHQPMKIEEKTFVKLFDFVDLFPHYFVGSNADLPIVGGSILSHDHFQGGKKVLPMFTRGARRKYYHPKFDSVKVSILDWYNSVVHLQSSDRDALQELATDILASWQSYSDKDADIIAKTDEPHNTITPIATLEDDQYNLYLILRNNRTDKQHPYGIFHPSEDLHNIKKEGIGLIEAMGIFILPGRLFSETQQIVDILTGKALLNFQEISKEDHPLSKHLCMIAQLTNDHGTTLTKSAAEKALVSYINNAAVRILNCTAVFKNDEKGQESFNTFLISSGCMAE